MNQTRIKTIFHFHELSLPVIEHEGGEFVPVKPIIEHIGMNWRTALRTLQTDSRTKFFHFQHLNVPLPSGLGGSCAIQKSPIKSGIKTANSAPIASKSRNSKKPHQIGD